MSDWQAGDLALCVRTLPNHFTGDPHPCRKGGLYVVSDVVLCPVDGLGLRLKGITFSNCGLAADTVHNYRRVPPHKADEWDRETIALMNGKPVPVAA